GVDARAQEVCGLLVLICSHTACLERGIRRSSATIGESADEEDRRMRIAQVSPVWESVPPQGYGGTERVVSYLTEELVRQGHEVTLFASGDSQTAARLVPVCDHAVRPSDTYRDATPLHMVEIEQVLAEAHAFDMLHFHLE